MSDPINRRDALAGIGAGFAAMVTAGCGNPKTPVAKPAAVRAEAEVDGELPVHNNLLPDVKPGEFMAWYGEGKFALNDPAGAEVLEALEKAKVAIVSPENNTWPKDYLAAAAAKGKVHAAVVFMENHIPDAGTVTAVDFGAIKAAVKAEVAAAQKQGFNGVFLSGIDEAIANETAEKARFKGIKDTMVELVREIREENPDLVLLLNRGMEIGKQTAPYADGIVVVNGFSDKGQPRPESDVKWVQAKTKEATRAASRAGNELKLFSIDAPAEAAVNKVAATAIKEGFVPFTAPADGNLVNFAEQPAYKRGLAK